MKSRTKQQIKSKIQDIKSNGQKSMKSKCQKVAKHQRTGSLYEATHPSPQGEHTFHSPQSQTVRPKSQNTDYINRHTNYIDSQSTSGTHTQMNRTRSQITPNAQQHKLNRSTLLNKLADTHKRSSQI